MDRKALESANKTRKGLEVLLPAEIKKAIEELYDLILELRNELDHKRNK